MPPRLREALALIPALAALGIAVLYTAGAIVKSGQLRGAGMNVRDTLPLVPLQQILTLGIGTLVASIAWFVSLAFVLWLYLFKFKDWGFGEPWTISPRAMRWWNLFGVGGYVLLIGGLVYWFWVQPFFSAVAWSATFLIGIFAAQTHRGRRYVATALAIYFLILIAANVGEAYRSPEPLARAEVTMLSGEVVRGPLVTTDSGSWYVATSRGHFRMIPASQVQSANVHSVKRTHKPRPILQVVWEHVRGWF